jgi:hypothetical protein
MASRLVRALGLLFACQLLSCSGGERTLGPSIGGPDPIDPGDIVGTPCEDGDVRDCHVTMQERDGVITCYSGISRCGEDGKFGECVEGTTKTLSLPRASAGLRVQALLPEECEDNPCDPGCQVFDEEPVDPIEAVGGDSIYNWNTGSLAGYPNGLVKKGLVEPCETGEDCQFNMYCSAPTSGSCAHGVCETGVALADECTDCVSAICDADPTCCEEEVEVDTCTHDPCAKGTYLKTGCNSCVTKICAANPDCCDKNKSWTAACVAAVATVCGNTCSCDASKGQVSYGGKCYALDSSSRKYTNARSTCTGYASGSWDLIQIDSAAENTFLKSQWGTANEVWLGLTESSTSKWTWSTGTPTGFWNESTRSGPFYTNWPSSEPSSSTENCVTMNPASATGQWNGRSCSSSYKGVCEGPAEKMVVAATAPHTWSASCVAKVATVCGARCDAADASNDAGACTPWYPGETSSSCTGIDLAVGVPCDGVIPVCNHGQATAPSGIKIRHYPANSQQYPACNPGNHAQMKECTTTAPIPPGECINVTTCPDLSGNREIIVNPGQPVAECSCLDNWSLFSSGESCIEPICAGGSSQATIIKKPVDIVFVIDNSGSMAGEIEQVQNLISTDFADIIAAADIDYRVIMFSRYGDVDVAVGGSDHPICISSPLGGNACTDPVNESLTLNPPNFYHYSVDVGSLDSWCDLIASFNQPDEYASPARTWTARAPLGWSQWLRESATKVFVEISDDDVSCSVGSTTFTDLNTSAGGTTAAAAFDTALRALSPAHFGTATARNYVWHSIVGMKANNPSTTPWPATSSIQTQTCGSGSEGAGTGYQALSKLTGGLRYPICLNSNFDAMFNAIATSVVAQSSAACDYALPENDGTFDPNKTSLVYSTVANNGNDVSTTLVQVANLAACKTNAWYFDDPSDPSKITLCPTTCNTVKTDTNARVWAEIGCPGGAEPLTATFEYEGLCGQDEGVRWLDLGYTSTVPTDATISFRARVAGTKDDLPDSDWVNLGTATSTNALCGLGSGCEIDVYSKLGAADAQLPALELEVTLTPSSGGESPSLSDWKLTYTCPDNQ